MKHNKYWFKPKTYGYGACPVSWEGWAFVVLAIVLILLSSVLFLEHNEILFMSSVILIAVLVTIVSKVKTKGDWKWRWGTK